jgi:hypothetical protein
MQHIDLFTWLRGDILVKAAGTDGTRLFNK